MSCKYFLTGLSESQMAVRTDIYDHTLMAFHQPKEYVIT